MLFQMVFLLLSGTNLLLAQTPEDIWKFGCARMDIFSFVRPKTNDRFPYDVDCRQINTDEIQGDKPHHSIDITTMIFVCNQISFSPIHLALACAGSPSNYLLPYQLMSHKINSAVSKMSANVLSDRNWFSYWLIFCGYVAKLQNTDCVLQ